MRRRRRKTSLGAFASLTRTQVRNISKELKANGSKLPQIGYCRRVATGHEICRDRRGYFLVGR